MASSNSNRYKMSQERLEELKKELNYMETVREKEVSEQIKEARSFGDLSENSEYDEAKTEQGKLYSRIAEYKDLIEHAEIVDNVDHNLPKDAVTLGSFVTVRDLDDEFETWTMSLKISMKSSALRRPIPARAESPTTLRSAKA